MKPRALEVSDLQTVFRTRSGLIKAVDGVSYYLDEGETIGLVGESGCGKSMSQMSVLQLIPNPPGRIVGGQVMFENQDILKFSPKGPEMRSIRGGKIAMIFQEPMTSFNPVLTIAQQLNEMIELHTDMRGKQAREHSIRMLELVGIPAAEKRIDDYPHQFSGGMLQRVMIAMALSCRPKVIIADEPTTALDVTTQAQLLELMKDVVNRFSASLVIVTHNLGVVARYTQRIYVMYAGRIVESGTNMEIFADPRHPYTRGLLACVPKLGESRGRRLVPIEGLPPRLINMPPTCAFLPRCPCSVEACGQEPRPGLRPVSQGHYVACHRDIEGAEL